eukprot:109891_1
MPAFPVILIIIVSYFITKKTFDTKYVHYSTGLSLIIDHSVQPKHKKKQLILNMKIQLKLNIVNHNNVLNEIQLIDIVSGVVQSGGYLPYSVSQTSEIFYVFIW